MKCYPHLKNRERFENAVGSLGGGNHFIEIDVDEEGNHYLIIHSGSRNLGKQVAEYYQNMAIETLCGKGNLLELKRRLIEEYKAGETKGNPESPEGVRIDLPSFRDKNPKRIVLSRRQKPGRLSS